MQKISSVLIIANGAAEGKSFLKTQARAHDFILALDGGADIALKAGVTPDLAAGDLDSISAAARKRLGAVRLFKIARQDNTDLEKGLDLLSFIKPKNVTIVCAAGGRLDFTLSNFSSVFGYVKKFDIVFAGKGWRVYPLIKTRAFKTRRGAKVSLIPMDKCQGITLKNLKYPLKNASLKPGQTAVSNMAAAANIEVKLKTGKLLAMIYE
ncbi:MAG: thiamine diphosphokinase [Elusimicrobiota bacterium]|jgi:thiamine pyrophosphokinase|nr:thiamine diphosphokinase [Elusimicrobiota bacterium]